MNVDALKVKIKDTKKDIRNSVLQIRLTEEEKLKLMTFCRENDIPAASMIRALTFSFINDNQK